MLNAFLKYGIIIVFLITFLNKTSANSCDYNDKKLKDFYSNFLKNKIADVNESVNNFLGIRRSVGNISEMFPDQCDNSTVGNRTKKHFNKNCYNLARNVSSCCQIKNLVYIGCVLHHQMKNLNTKSSEGKTLEIKLITLVNDSDNKLCMKLPNHRKTRRSTRGPNVKSASSEKKRFNKISETIEGFHHHWQKFSGSVNCA